MYAWMHRGLVVAAAWVLLACDSVGPTPAPQMATPPLPEPDSSGARLVTEKCGVCHVPPRPTAHLAQEWPMTVRRMQNHRLSFGKGALSEDEMAQIIGYLQRHARSPTP